ncbi:MAG: FmdB family zinc ribbon protein [Candidatus Polarisedimenticolia bacterium]
MYEYECTKCGHRFEVIQKFSDRPRRQCPKCKGTLRKLLSASAIQFKGSGWYVTDYGKKRDGATEKKAPAKDPGQTSSTASADDKAKPVKKDGTKGSKDP